MEGVLERCRALLPWSLVIAALLSSCGSGTQTTLVLYNGQHPQLTDAFVSAFENQTGIAVSHSDNDGVILADEILAEGSHTPADIFLTENSPELELLDEHGLLAKLPSSILSAVPSSDSAPDGSWVGIALRVNCLAYNPSLISRSELPSSLMDLSQPAWKGKLAIAPTDSDFLPLVGAVAATRGVNAARSWLEGLKANAKIYQDDESVVASVNSGQAAVGVINQYYWYRLQLNLGASHMASRIYYFPHHDIGALENISGAAILASSPHRSADEKFLSFLVSPAGQKLIAEGGDFEYPARPGIAPNPALPPLSSLASAPVNVVSLGDDREAANLLLSSGLESS